MSESLHSEPVRARRIFEDQTDRPFDKRAPGKVPASLGIRGVEPALPTFEKTGKTHNRNINEIAKSRAVVWGGPLPGDIYGATTIKGTSMWSEQLDGIKIEENKYTAYGIRGFGLMDDYDLPTIFKSSEYLRSHGLPTEKPVKVMELREVYVGHGKERRKIPIEEWEKEALDSFRGKYLYEKITYNKVKRYLKETKFIALERDVQVNERIQDIIDLPLETTLKYEMEPIFKWLNTATKARDGGLISETPKPEPFNVTGEDLKRYFESYLPSQMGTYLGRFHRLGLVHRFLHTGNWSIVGTIYDLDSVTGKVLFSDDAKPTVKKYLNDITSSLGCIETLNKTISRRDEPGIPEVDLATQNYNFARGYLLEKYKGNERISLEEIGENKADLYLLRKYESYVAPEDRVKPHPAAPKPGKFQRLLNYITKK